MSVYRQPAAVFKRPARASWWRRNFVAWWHGTLYKLDNRRWRRYLKVVAKLDRHFGTHSAGPG